jgi:hypothetical protein
MSVLTITSGGLLERAIERDRERQTQTQRARGREGEVKTQRRDRQRDTEREGDGEGGTETEKGTRICFLSYSHLLSPQDLRHHLESKPPAQEASGDLSPWNRNGPGTLDVTCSSLFADPKPAELTKTEICLLQFWRLRRSRSRSRGSSKGLLPVVGDRRAREQNGGRD